MEIKKSHDLPPTIWRPQKASGYNLVQVWKAENQRSQLFKSYSEVQRRWDIPTQVGSQEAKRTSFYIYCLSLFVNFTGIYNYFLKPFFIIVSIQLAKQEQPFSMDQNIFSAVLKLAPSNNHTKG